MSGDLFLTYSRIKSLLTEADIRFSEDEDNEVRVIIEGSGNINGDIVVLFSIVGKGVLCVRGFGRDRMSEKKKAEILLLCNQWNLEKRWPKCYYDEDSLRAVCEHNVDFEGGVIRDTLRDNVVPTIGSMLKFHKYLSEKL